MFDIDFSRVIDQFCFHVEEPMVFTSGIFLWIMLIFSTLYALLWKKDALRIIFVTAFSYYFYYKSSGHYFLVLALVTVSDFYLGKLLAKQEAGSQKAKVLLTASLLVDLGLLCYFKYTNFLGSILMPDWTRLDIFLPVGVSFFTFQSLSYTIDIYRKRLQPLNSLLDYAFYVSFFPQLVAGPIVRASDFIPQIHKPVEVTQQMLSRGLGLILLGLFKKAVISDYISINFVDRIFGQPTFFTGIENLLGVYGYTLQIYCDFSGYSDIAIGIALLLGFHFPDNFRLPYRSASITEFWRRWHISLSSWLKDYLYISLGGNRKGKVRQYANLLITMLLGGLWHGANFTFVFWGGFHGLMLCLDKYWHQIKPEWSAVSLLPSKNKQTTEVRNAKLLKIVSCFVTFHLVAFSWIFFRSDDFDTALNVLEQIFTNLQPSIILQWIEGYPSVALLMLIGYTMHFMPHFVYEKGKDWFGRLPLWGYTLCFIALIWLIMQVKSSEIVPFIYFQF